MFTATCRRQHGCVRQRRCAGALWIDELPDFDLLATELATSLAGDGADKGVNWDSVGRPGLDPGTMGSKERFRTSSPFVEIHLSSPVWV
jgi:hypothetical protein